MRRYQFAILALIAWGITYPALLANIQNIDRGNELYGRIDCRHEMGFAILLGLVPPMWLAAPFITGFYENGFQFTCKH